MDGQTIQTVAHETTSWSSWALWTFLGLIGAGIKVGTELGKGTKLNPYQVGTTLVAGAAFAGVSTSGIVNYLGVQWSGFAGGVALVVGLMAIGFVSNVLEGKVPLLNKLMGNKNV